MAGRGLSIKPGVIAHVKEINAMSPAEVVGRSVRVLGRVVEYDAGRNRLILEHGGSQFLVNTELLVGVRLAPRVMTQFIGEIEAAAENPFRLILRARVARVVNGLDMTLYDQVVRLRRIAEARQEELMAAAQVSLHACLPPTMYYYGPLAVNLQRAADVDAEL